MSNITVSRHNDVSYRARSLILGLGLTLSLGATLSLVGCQGELKLNDGVAKPPIDMAVVNCLPPTIGYADINKDLDTPPGLGCTNQIGACHGGATPTGQLALADQAAGDMVKLMSNYNNVKMRVNTGDPASSLLLLKMLSTSAGGTSHVGGTYFQNTDNCMYKSWLAWIQLGAQFDAVSTAGVGGN